MSRSNNTSFWLVSGPAVWPGAPRWMSFSTLSELQACPRRWALTSAEYPHLWGHSGYPRSPQLFTLEGTVVHLALQKITQSLADRRCHSLLHESAISVIKDLGGFTVIINDCLQRALRPYEENPRVAPVLEGIRRRLAAKVPELRSRVQILLSRIHLESSSDGPCALTHHDGELRNQLPYGSYAEIELRVPELNWHGFADLLTISAVSSEIRDFKTGTYKEKHEAQLRTYALLWARDRNLNPSGRLAKKLVISYVENDLEVSAPNESDLCALEHELRKQTREVLAHLKVDPPEARPRQENCVCCSVRHLCEEYWQWLAGHKADDQSLKGQCSDLQIKLLSRHGPSSWDGVVKSSSVIEVGWPILLRISNIPFYLHTGQVIRLLNIYLGVSEERLFQGEPSPAIATMGPNTQVFLIPG
jgi:hypothetical protein